MTVSKRWQEYYSIVVKEWCDTKTINLCFSNSSDWGAHNFPQQEWVWYDLNLSHICRSKLSAFPDSADSGETMETWDHTCHVHLPKIRKKSSFIHISHISWLNLLETSCSAPAQRQDTHVVLREGNEVTNGGLWDHKRETHQAGCRIPVVPTTMWRYKTKRSDDTAKNTMHKILRKNTTGTLNQKCTTRPNPICHAHASNNIWKEVPPMVCIRFSVSVIAKSFHGFPQLVHAHCGWRTAIFSVVYLEPSSGGNWQWEYGCKRSATFLNWIVSDPEKKTSHLPISS